MRDHELSGPSITSALTRSISWGVTGGGVIGFSLGVNLLYFLQLNMELRDALALSLILAGIAIAGCTALFLLLSTACWAIGMLFRSNVFENLHRKLFLSILLFLAFAVPAVTAFTMHNRPLDYTSLYFRAINGAILALVAAITLTVVFRTRLFFTSPRLEGSPSPRPRRMLMPLISTAGYLLSILSILSLTHKPDVTPEDPSMIRGLIQDTGAKVVFVGLDAATWDIMDPMLKNGELPAFQRIIDTGAIGTLMSTVSPIQPFVNSASVGMKSPCLWTTAMTGKSERSHGIQDMEVTLVKGLRRPLPFRVPYFREYFDYFPVNSSLRQVKSLWNILSDFDRDVGILGWWPSWPPEEVKGFVVSDWCIFDGIDRKTHPPELYYEHRMDEIIDEAGDILAPIMHQSGVRKQTIPPRFLRLLKRDILFTEIGPGLLELYRPDLFAVYFKGTDVLGHLFWVYYQPEEFEWEKYVRGRSIEEKERRFRLYKKVNVIESYYSLMDEALGELMEAMGEETVLIVCSDHGMGPWKSSKDLVMTLWDEASHSLYSGNHRREGIIMMYGKPVTNGRTLDGATLFDIAPTILYLLGFPVPTDMPGEVLVDALSPEFREKIVLHTIRTYETGEKIFDGPMASPADHEVEEHLKALGYIN